MQLDTSRFLNDRFVFDDSQVVKFRVANSLWDWCKRIICWIWSLSSYSEENIRAISCFKKYLVDTLGKERLQRICSRYTMDLDAMEKKGSPLLSRDMAKIVVGAKNVSVEDINEHILRNQADPRFMGKNSFIQLDAATLSEVQSLLAKRFDDLWTVSPILSPMSGRPTEWFSRIFFDPFLADRERLQLMEEHPTDSYETFVHNMTARVIKREMNVGTLVPAPTHPDGRKQFYYVSAKIVTGKGMVSYILHPATADTNLEAIRLFRGTSPRNSDVDAISTMITDLEKDLGRSAYESGAPYEPIIQQKLGLPPLEGGHSMGSTLVQYRLANMDHIRKAFLYCGPGLPEKEVDKFNAKNPAVHLVIRTTSKDLWNTMGDAHLGYQAPENVHVDFRKYYPPFKPHGDNPHVTVWGKEKYYYGIEGGMASEFRDIELHSKLRPKELIRSLLGPLIAKILKLFRSFIRTLFSSRVEIERGAKIGTMQAGRWQVDHFRTI